jgi:hypothetical protein
MRVERGEWSERRRSGGQVLRRKRGVREVVRGGEGGVEREAKRWSSIAPQARRSRRRRGGERWKEGQRRSRSS